MSLLLLLLFTDCSPCAEEPRSQSEINIKMENNNDYATLNPELPSLNSFIIPIFKRISGNLSENLN